MSNEETYEELTEAFSKLKNELKFKATFEELEEIFFLKDDAMSNGFISDRYDRQLCSRIVNAYFSWYNKLHAILMPNPQSIINMTENQAFNDEEKNKLNLLMNKIMAYIAKNTVNGLKKDIYAQGKFIDEGLNFWNDEIQKELEFVTERIQEYWEKYSKEDAE